MIFYILKAIHRHPPPEFLNVPEELVLDPDTFVNNKHYFEPYIKEGCTHCSGDNMKSKKSSKQKTYEQYSKVSDAYVRSQSHAKGIDLDLLITMTKPEKKWLSLDVATGGGHTALAVAPYVKKVIAIDMTPNMLRTAKTFIREDKGILNVEFQLADAEDLPFKNNHFDLVTCRIASHHFPDCHEFVRESLRVLKKGGLLLVQDHVLPEDEATAQYIEQFERLRDPSHYRAYSEKEWRTMFKIAGFEVEKSVQLVKRHEFVEWAKRMNNTGDTLYDLVQMMKNATDVVVDWFMPFPSAIDFDSPQASFVNHHIIITGRK